MTPTIPPRGRLNVKFSIEFAVAVALAECFGLDHHVAQARPGRDADFDGVLAFLRLLRQHLLVGRETRLGFGLASARRGAHPFELARKRALASRLGLFFAREPLALLIEPGRIVALPGNALAAIELENPAGDIVEEVAIVGDGHDGAGVFL